MKYWLPVIVWMGLIFSASGDKRSAQHSSRIIGPIVRWLFPQLAEESVELIVFLIRKCAHLTEYALLALLVWRALRKPVRRDPRPWLWREAGWTLLFCALYAASDEFHQSFIPQRQGRFHDVVIDSVGAGAGLLALWLLGKWRKQWGDKTSASAGSPSEIAP